MEKTDSMQGLMLPSPPQKGCALHPSPKQGDLAEQGGGFGTCLFVHASVLKLIWGRGAWVWRVLTTATT